MKIYQLLIITFLTSCNNCPIIPNNTESFQDVSLGVCLASGLPENEYIINSESEFKKLQNNGNCSTQQTNIDFSSKTLLGKFTSGKCQLTIKKSVVVDKTNKTYTYYLGVCEEGLCKSLAVNMNWITVNKIETGYSVKFVVENR